MSVVRPSQMRLPSVLEQRAEGHVVDQRAPHRLEAARPLQRLGPDQHAAAGPGRGAALRVVDLLERIELREEVDERGHDHPLPRRLRAEQGHLGDQDAVVVFCGPDQVAQRGRRPGDVRVGEQHVLGGRAPGHCGGQALGHRPHLAGPAVRPWLAGDDGQRRAAVLRGLLAELGGDAARAVVAPVINQEDTELTGVVLRQQPGQRRREGVRLIARGHDGDDRRPRRGSVPAARPDGSRSPVRQKPPCAATR